ncbi:MAG: hypothetical protein M3O25_08670, partial [Actinomycetota bacterium]|nr:hypothetical protein [Actinomycetota bacterium]
VWVARHDADKVSRIDPASGTESIPVPTPGRIAIGEDSVWVVAEDGRRLVRIDPKTRKVTKRIPTDVRQGDCDCSPGGLAIADGELFAAVPRKGRVDRYDAITGDDRGTIEMGPGFEGYFAIGGGMLWGVESPVQGLSEASFLVRIDLSSNKRKRNNLGGPSYLSGVTYSEGGVWIADAANAQNRVVRFDPKTLGTTGAKIPTALSGDDIAGAAPGVILVWEPGDGHLTRVDSNTIEAAGSQKPRGYRTKQEVNRVWSDLAVADGAAWVTDPAAGLVHKLDF